MKLNARQLRNIIETVVSPDEQTGPAAPILVIIPFVIRGELDFTKTERHGFGIVTASQSETPGNRSAFIAWKAAPDEETATEMAEELSHHFSNFVTFYSDRGGLKSWHTLVHLVDSNTTIYNSAMPEEPDYMFDGKYCSNSELKKLGIL